MLSAHAVLDREPLGTGIETVTVPSSVAEAGAADGARQRVFAPTKTRLRVLRSWRMTPPWPMRLGATVWWFLTVWVGIRCGRRG